MGLPYSQAAAYLQDYIPMEGEDFDMIDRLEVIVLKHRPHSPVEALQVVRVLRSNIEAGPRSDECDIGACDNLIDWLTAMVGDASAATGPTAS